MCFEELDIMSEIRSRPYQNERDKVLDELERIIKDRIDDNEKRQENVWNSGGLDAAKTYLLTCGEVLSSVLEEISELRQVKE